jgi:hypothetical protein
MSWNRSIHIWFEEEDQQLELPTNEKRLEKQHTPRGFSTFVLLVSNQKHYF